MAPLRATNEPVDFVLSIQQRITRRYHGPLEIKPSAGSLIAVVSIDRETAVASVVAAESGPDTPAEAVKAQLIKSNPNS
jgi:peptidoglycan hydrolase-like amidase